MSQTAVTAEVGATGDSAWRSVARSGGARLIVLPVSAVLGIVNTRLIFEHYGPATYNQYGLLVTIGSLIPFTDLGMSTAVMNSVAASDDPRHDREVRRVLLTAIRVLLVSALVLLAVCATISLTGQWRHLLGDGLLPGTGATAAALCVVVLAVSIPMGIGQRILAGLGRNHVSIAVLGLQTPVVLVLIASLVLTGSGGTGWFIPVLPFLVTLALAAWCVVLSARRISPAVGAALRDVPRVRSVRGGRVLDVAWPTLVQMVALPVALQSDRVVLSHLGTRTDLSQYNLAAQLYAPVWAIVSSAGVALWPVFARIRAGRSGDTTSPFRMAWAFGGAGVVMTGGLTLAGPWLAARASDGQVHLPWALMLSFAVFMIFQSAKYPLGVYLTDPAGLRFQAYMIIILLPVNLGLSLPLAVHYGAPGPVIGSAVSVLVCQVVANYVYVRRRLARESRAATPPTTVPDRRPTS